MKAKIIRTSENHPGGMEGYIKEINSIEELFAIDYDGEDLLVTDARNKGYEFDFYVEIVDDYLY